MRQYKLPDDLEKWTLVSVTWEDAATFAGPQKSGEIVKTASTCLRHTCGYVLEYTDERILIATTDDREAGMDKDDCEDVTLIPVPYIRRIWISRRPN